MARVIKYVAARLVARNKFDQSLEKWNKQANRPINRRKLETAMSAAQDAGEHAALLQAFDIRTRGVGVVFRYFFQVYRWLLIGGLSVGCLFGGGYWYLNALHRLSDDNQYTVLSNTLTIRPIDLATGVPNMDEGVDTLVFGDRLYVPDLGSERQFMPMDRLGLWLPDRSDIGVHTYYLEKPERMALFQSALPSMAARSDIQFSGWRKAIIEYFLAHKWCGPNLAVEERERLLGTDVPGLWEYAPAKENGKLFANAQPFGPLVQSKLMPELSKNRYMAVIFSRSDAAERRLVIWELSSTQNTKVVFELDIVGDDFGTFALQVASSETHPTIPKEFKEPVPALLMRAPEAVADAVETKRVLIWYDEVRESFVAGVPQFYRDYAGRFRMKSQVPEIDQVGAQSFGN